MNDTGYINIQGWMINRLKLKGNELILYALIYGFSQDGKTRYHGSTRYTMRALGIVSNNTVMSLFKRLIEKGFIICCEDKQNGNKYYVDMGVVQKVHHGGAETAPQGGAESAPNIYNTNNNTNNNIVHFEEIWELYNYKKGKRKAQDKFLSFVNKSKEPEKLVEEMKTGISAYKQELEIKEWLQQQQLQFWLNGERWKDEYEKPKKTGKQSNIIHTQSDKYKNINITKAKA